MRNPSLKGSISALFGAPSFANCAAAFTVAWTAFSVLWFQSYVASFPGPIRAVIEYAWGSNYGLILQMGLLNMVTIITISGMPGGLLYVLNDGAPFYFSINFFFILIIIGSIATFAPFGNTICLAIFTLFALAAGIISRYIRHSRLIGASIAAMGAWAPLAFLGRAILHAGVPSYVPLLGLIVAGGLNAFIACGTWLDAFIRWSTQTPSFPTRAMASAAFTIMMSVIFTLVFPSAALELPARLFGLSGTQFHILAVNALGPERRLLLSCTSRVQTDHRGGFFVHPIVSLGTKYLLQCGHDSWLILPLPVQINE